MGFPKRQQGSPFLPWFLTWASNPVGWCKPSRLDKSLPTNSSELLILVLLIKCSGIIWHISSSTCPWVRKAQAIVICPKSKMQSEQVKTYGPGKILGKNRMGLKLAIFPHITSDHPNPGKRKTGLLLTPPLLISGIGSNYSVDTRDQSLLLLSTEEKAQCVWVWVSQLRVKHVPRWSLAERTPPTIAYTCLIVNPSSTPGFLGHGSLHQQPFTWLDSFPN